MMEFQSFQQFCSQMNSSSGKSLHFYLPNEVNFDKSFLPEVIFFLIKKDLAHYVRKVIIYKMTQLWLNQGTC